MSLSTDTEEDVNAFITEYGNAVTIQKQTGTYDSYRQISWSDSGSGTSATGVILPFRAGDGEEWQLLEEGIVQPGDYICYLKASETIAESIASTTRTRYLLVHNSLRYEIIHIKKYEIQDNLVYYKLYIRKLTT